MRKSLSWLAALALMGAAQAATIEMHVNGLVCAFCAQGIEKTLRKIPATADVVVSLEHRLVAVALKEGEDIPDERLRETIADAGYAVTAIDRTQTPIAEIRARVRSKAE